MSGGSSGGGSQLDPKMRDAFLANVTRATGVAENLGGRQFADWNPDQATALTYARGAADPNSEAFRNVSNAGSIASRAGNYQYERVNPEQLNRRSIRDVSGGSFLNQNIDAYMNPYTQGVIEQGQKDIERGRQIAQLSDADQAVRAKAFGGSRQGVAEAETNRAYSETANKFIADQRQKAYEAATGLQSQDLARQLQANLANQGVDLSTGTLNTNLRQGASLANQQAGLTANQQRIAAAQALAGIGGQQQGMQIAGGNNLLSYGDRQQKYMQDQLDAIRNLPLEQQQIINQALGLNVGGGSGATSTQYSKNGLLGLLGL